MKPPTETPKKGWSRKTLALMGLFFIGGAVVTAVVIALLMNILQKKQESATPNYQVVQLTSKSFDPAEWGKNYPAQYEGWLKTSEMPAEEKQPNTATADDPRTFKAKSKLAADPRLVTMWQGYPFAVEYNEPRGHAYMMDDQRLVKRVQAPFKQPGACLNCHVSVPEVLDKIGGDPAAAWASMNKMPFGDASKLASHPVSCIDCHDPATMKLKITRPAFAEGIKAYKASQGIKDFDVNRDATHQEMRSFVCAQCHVEYYFKGDEKTLTFPWSKGLTADDAMKYYDEVGFSDFTNTVTGAKVLKAQHPDFETWAQGVHAANGVGCADCHMPYTRQGAGKVSDHQVRSPLASTEQINKTCLTCHHTTEDAIKKRVEGIQHTWKDAQNVSFDALDQLIRDIAEARKNGTPEANIEKARQWQRKAQFFQDYTVSENSRGFHAPQYSMNLINQVTDASRRGQLALRGIDLPVTKDATKYEPMKGVPSPAAPAAPQTPITNPVYRPAS